MNEHMIDDLAALLRNTAARAGRRGMRVSYEWLRGVLDDDDRMTRQVLLRAGFTPPRATEWSVGGGGAALSHFTYPATLEDAMTDILEDYDAA